MNHSHTAVH